MYKTKKYLFAMAILLIIILSFNGCDNPKAEAFKKEGLQEVSLNIYKGILEFKKDKNNILLASYGEGVGMGGNYQHTFSFANITKEQYETAINKINELMNNDGKLINNEYSQIMWYLKKCNKDNEILEQEKIKKDIINNIKN